MKQNTINAAKAKGLDIVTITKGANDYPEYLYDAISGFDTFEDAEAFAQDVNGDVVKLRQRDGHHFWENTGNLYYPLQIREFVNWEDNEVILDLEEFEWWKEQEIDFMTDNEWEEDDINARMTKIEEIAKAVSEMGSDMALVLRKENLYYYTEKKCPTEIRQDVYTYEVAVVDNEDDDE